MSAEDNKAQVRRFFANLYAGRTLNLDAFDDFYAEDIDVSLPFGPPTAGLSGLEAAKASLKPLKAAITDNEVHIVDLIAEGDKAACQWESVGTHSGELMGVPATGRRITFTNLGIWQFANGRVVKARVLTDLGAAMQRLKAEAAG